MGLRISNIIVGFVNFVGLLVSLALVGLSARWLSLGGAANECESALRLPLLAAGGVIFVASVLGLVGACCWRATTVLWIYLIVIFLVILTIFAATIAAFVMTHRGQGHRMRDFSHFLHRGVWQWKNWVVIESCLREARVCGGGSFVGVSTSGFYRQNLAPIQSGCCKPPGYCELTHVNTTYWKIPEFGVTVSSPDCDAWSNKGGNLCFSCNSCKGGVLIAFREWWRNITIFNIVVLAFLIILHSLGGCALTNNRARRRRSRSQP